MRWTIGSSISRGSSPRIAATLPRMSCEATWVETSRWKKITMFERPSCDVDSTCRMPSTVLIASSIALRDLALDRLGRGARVDGGDGHDGELDVGELVDLELAVGRDAQHGQGHHHHGGEDGLLDREVAQEHVTYLAAWTSTGAPEPSATGGSSTTTSPAFSPLAHLDGVGRLHADLDRPALGLAPVDDEHLGGRGVAAVAHQRCGRHHQRARHLSDPDDRAREQPAHQVLCWPGTSTTTSNERVRSSTSGVTRATRPLDLATPAASTETSTGCAHTHLAVVGRGHGWPGTPGRSRPPA